MENIVPPKTIYVNSLKLLFLIKSDEEATAKRIIHERREKVSDMSNIE